MPLADVLMERFKVTTRAVENPRNLTSVGAAARVVLANNPNRFAFIVINLSVNPMYMGLENDVSEDKGIRLDANGGSFSCIWDEDFELTAWAWWIIAPAGVSNLYSLEVVEG